jgi:hypothetical protein
LNLPAISRSLITEGIIGQLNARFNCFGPKLLAMSFIGSISSFTFSCAEWSFMIYFANSNGRHKFIDRTAQGQARRFARQGH